MRLYYCPECGREEIKDDYLCEYKITYQNIRDGYGRPITHYKCECGNLLAGSMSILGWGNDKNAINYSKEVIKAYNKNGCFYPDGLYEWVEKRYKEKIDSFNKIINRKHM